MPQGHPFYLLARIYADSGNDAEGDNVVRSLPYMRTV